MRENNQAKKVDASTIIDTGDAVHRFQQLGGQITVFTPFGEDPLMHTPELVHQRETEFKQHYPDFSRFFHTVVNSNNSLFCEGLLCLIRISKHLEAS